MTEVEKRADYVMDHTDMAIMAYHEKGSDDITTHVGCEYSELIGLVAYLIWGAHTETGLPLEVIGQDLNQAVAVLSEMEGE